MANKKEELPKCSLDNCKAIQDKEQKEGFSLAYFVKSKNAFRVRWFCKYSHLLLWLHLQNPDNRENKSEDQQV